MSGSRVGKEVGGWEPRKTKDRAKDGIEGTGVSWNGPIYTVAWGRAGQGCDTEARKLYSESIGPKHIEQRGRTKSRRSMVDVSLA